MTTNQLHIHVKPIIDQIASTIVHARQFQNDLRQQYTHDRSALNELNQHFHLFVDRIQLLQLQNFKYLAAIADIRQQFPNIDFIDTKQDYTAAKNNFVSVSNNKIDYEWDYQIFQLQIAIYQQLIAIAEQSSNKQLLSLEQELHQSTSVLDGLRSSYEQLQYDVDSLQRQNNTLSKQYLTLTIDWGNVKRQQSKWDLGIDTLKNYIAFYQNLRLYTAQESNCWAFDINQYCALELNKLIGRIRGDCEDFYRNVYQEMVLYYNRKTDELQTVVKHELECQQNEVEQFVKTQQKMQIELNKQEGALNHEKQIFSELNDIYRQLEVELASLQLYYNERLTEQSNELYDVQDCIMTIVDDIDEIKRSKVNLQMEIIIYRQLLEANGIEPPALVVRRLQLNENEKNGGVIIESRRKGSIGIKECAPNGSYISLMNFSARKSIDISRWSLLRHIIDTNTKLHYTIPDGYRLEHGRELRIYAKFYHNSWRDPQVLVNNNIDSWNDGNKIKTYLFNRNGDEEAVYKQSTTIRKCC